MWRQLGFGLEHRWQRRQRRDGGNRRGHRRRRRQRRCGGEQQRCGHAEPPFEGPSGYSKYKGLWDFALDHPYWLGAGQSPYSGGLPGDMPEWCGIGKDSATPRTGACADPSQC